MSFSVESYLFSTSPVGIVHAANISFDKLHANDYGQLTPQRSMGLAVHMLFVALGRRRSTKLLQARERRCINHDTLNRDLVASAQKL